MNDAFSKYHPAVNFLFFSGAISCGVLFQHPAYLTVGSLCATAYYLLLADQKGQKGLWLMLLLFFCVALINPLVNSQGQHILFYVFGRPYTLEALFYGCASGGVLFTMFLWFGCYNRVMTGDKFTCLFGNLLPSLSLLLVMVLRMVPGLIRKAKMIQGARRSVGKESRDLQEGMTVLNTLLSWSLEGSVATADSMRARGYGTCRRQSFLIYRIQKRDAVLIVTELILLTGVIISACNGQTDAVFIPTASIAPLSWGILIYAVFLSIPLALNIKEALLWHISISKI